MRFNRVSLINFPHVLSRNAHSFIMIETKKANSMTYEPPQGKVLANRTIRDAMLNWTIRGSGTCFVQNYIQLYICRFTLTSVDFIQQALFLIGLHQIR